MPTLLYDELQTIYKSMKYSMNASIFIETGTYEAETTIRMSHYFNQVYTIEVCEPLFKECKQKCNEYKNITCIFGDSAKRLPYLLSTIEDSAVFWLDGHWSMSKTSFIGKQVPLLEELDAIYNNYKESGLIIIDDFRLFGQHIDVNWSDITIENIRNKLKERIVNEMIIGDRYIIELSLKK